MKIPTLFSEYPTQTVLYIIGNGFDIAHGIESRYSDFYQYVLRNHGFGSPIGLMNQFFGGSADFWSDIESAMGNYDAENIYDVCKPEEPFDYDHAFRDSAIHEDSTDAFFNPAMDQFDDFFCDWVDSIVVRGCEKVYNLDSDDFYLTFNYTDTLETIYGIPSEQICHIHGSRLDGNAYIIGHNHPVDPSDFNQDELLFKLNAMKTVVERMNHYKKDYDGIIAAHQQFFLKIDGKIDAIKVIGHSLSPIDWPYLEYIVHLLGEDIPWIIQCHGMEDIERAKSFVSKDGMLNAKIV